VRFYYVKLRITKKKKRTSFSLVGKKRYINILINLSYVPLLLIIILIYDPMMRENFQVMRELFEFAALKTGNFLLTQINGQFLKINALMAGGVLVGHIECGMDLKIFEFDIFLSVGQRINVILFDLPER